MPVFLFKKDTLITMSKILIIDDEEKLRSLLARIIKLEGYTVIEAGNLKAAHKTLNKEDIDVILCDVKLTDGNGVDFVKGNKASISFCRNYFTYRLRKYC